MPDLERQHEIEINLRGSLLDVAINFEVALQDIIYFSNADMYLPENTPPQTETVSKHLKIKGMTFGGKLLKVKELFEIYHKDLLIKYSILFSHLHDFLIFRNRMVHCAFYWIDDKLEDLEIWDIYEGEKKFQFYAPIKTTRTNLTFTTIFYLQKIPTQLLALRTEIRNRLKISHPNVFESLNGSLENME